MDWLGPEGLRLDGSGLPHPVLLYEEGLVPVEDEVEVLPVLPEEADEVFVDEACDDALCEPVLGDEA